MELLDAIAIKTNSNTATRDMTTDNKPKHLAHARPIVANMNITWNALK